MSKNQVENFEMFFREGFVTDLLWAQVHYIVYRTIGENFDAINRKEDGPEKRFIGYTQVAAHEMAVLCLSRLYDRKNSRYTVRCLDTVIEECERTNSKNFPVELEYYPSLQQMAAIAGVEIQQRHLDTQQGLIDFFRSVRESEVVKRSVEHLLFARDKFVAHNEHNPANTSIDTFWDDYARLINLGRLYQMAIGRIFLDTSYSVEEDVSESPIGLEMWHNCHWIFEYVANYVGRDVFANWIEKRG